MQLPLKLCVAFNLSNCLVAFTLSIDQIFWKIQLWKSQKRQVKLKCNLNAFNDTVFTLYSAYSKKEEAGSLLLQTYSAQLQKPVGAYQK